MSIFNAFSTMDNQFGDSDNMYDSVKQYTGITNNVPMINNSWGEQFKVHHDPTKFSFGTFFNPDPATSWCADSPMLAYMSEDVRNFFGPDKVDPNKIFTAETQSLRKVSVEQLKIIKMFEKKFMEGMTEKGKYGITEDDVLAFNALISARGQLTNNIKEQVAIKKNIAELKIKQQQADVRNNSSSDRSGISSGPVMSTDAIGRSVLDNIFSTAVPVNLTPSVPDNSYESISPDDASSVLDALIPKNDVSETIRYESQQPKTYVVIGDSDSDLEFQTYSASGELLPDYPNPNSKIVNIDKDTGKATDDLLVQYDIKYRGENGII